MLITVCHAGLPAPLEARVRSILEQARAVPDRAPEIKEELDRFLGEPPG